MHTDLLFDLKCYMLHVTCYMDKVMQFFLEAKAEMLKVNWPTKKQTVNYTLLVIAVSVVVAGFLGGLDSIFGFILRTYIIK